MDLPRWRFPIGPDGSTTDSDGDGLDDASTRMTLLDLHGTSSQGPVTVSLDPARPSVGQIEELINTTPGILDVQPFTPAGSAFSFFDVFAIIQVGPQIFHTAQPFRLQARISHKPPAVGESYVNPSDQPPVDLLDANGNRYRRQGPGRGAHPQPAARIDKFPDSQSDITVLMQNGSTETIHLTGSTTVQVAIPPNGAAADTDGNGLDDVPSLMTELDLARSSSIGPVHVTLNPAIPSTGAIEEQANATPGILDVPPFTAAGQATSFFDVFFQMEIAGLLLHNDTPAHMQSIIYHKPPAPGDTYINPSAQPIPLLDPNGKPTGITSFGKCICLPRSNVSASFVPQTS